MKHKLLKSLLLLSALVAGSSSVWATDQTAGYTPSAALSSPTGTVIGTANETWSYSITFDSEGSYYGYGSAFGWQLGAGPKDNKNRGCRAFSISTSDITGTITKIEVEAGSYQGNSKINVTVGGNDFGTQNQSTYNGQGALKSTFTGEATGEIVISATDAVRAFYLKSITVTYSTGSSTDPSISASNVNIAQDATNGSIEYSLSNATGNVSASITSGDWLTLGEITASAVPFTCSANTGAERTATVTLSYTGATDKVVTITQAAKTVAAPDFNLASSGYFLEGTDLTLTSAGNTIYYNLTTNGDTPDNPTSASTEYTGPIALSSGTVKVKAIAYDPYGNTSSVASRTVNGVAPATLPFNWAGGGKTALTALTGVVGSGLAADYSDAKYEPYYTKLDGTGDNILIFTDAKPLKVTIGVMMAGGGSTSKITVQESENGVSFTEVEDLTISGSQDDKLELVTTNPFANTTRVIKLLFTKGSNVGVGPIKIAGGSLPVTLNTSGYATFASSFALDFSDDSEFSAWQIKGVSGTKITFEQITGAVAAGTGVFLKGAASATVNIPVAASGTNINGTNKLEGVTDPAGKVVAANAYYGLYGDKFVKINPGIVPAGKAILPASVASVKEFTFDFGEDDADGINEVNGSEFMVNGPVYDLSGRRVQKPGKGLYIVNGKKILF